MARRKKQNEEEQQNAENINNESDDTFGLPEVDYQPLKRDEPRVEAEPEPTPEPQPEPEPVVEKEPVYERSYEPVEEQAVEEIHEEDHNHIHEDDHHEYKSVYSYMEENKNPQWPKILGFLLVFLIAAGVVYYFAFHLPEKEKEKARIAQQAELRRKQAVLDEAKRAEEQLVRDREQRRLDSLANLPKTGSLETLSGRTGRYYVVVASAIDVDLLTDFGKELVSKGSNVRIIPPFGKTKFNRLAVDVKDTYDEAQATADGMKGGDFGDQIWVVRY